MYGSGAAWLAGPRIEWTLPKCETQPRPEDHAANIGAAGTGDCTVTAVNCSSDGISNLGTDSTKYRKTEQPADPDREFAWRCRNHVLENRYVGVDIRTAVQPDSEQQCPGTAADQPAGNH